MTTDSNQIVFSTKLSPPLKNDFTSVFANVSRNRWTAPDNNIVHFVRFELKLFKGEKANPITVSLTATQFDWLIHCLENAPESQIVPGEREGKFICFEISDKIFGSTIISVVDKKSKFGILLENFETAALRTSAKVLSFIIKFQHASGDKLKELIRYLYASCIFSLMKNKIKSDCEGCTDDSIIDSKHGCNQISDQLLDEYFENAWELKDTIEEKYSEIFEHFINLLNVNDHNRLQAKDLIISIVKGEKKEMLFSIKEYFGGKDIKSSAFAILELLAIKEKINNTDNSITGDMSEDMTHHFKIISSQNCSKRAKI